MRASNSARPRLRTNLPAADRAWITPPASELITSKGPAPAIPASSRRRPSFTGRSLLAAGASSLSALAIAAAVGYILLRNPATNALDLRQVAREIGEALTPSPPIADSEAKIAAGRQGYFRPTLRYSPPFAMVVTRADRDGLDILADFTAFHAAWRKECGDKPLILRFVHPTLTEPYTGQPLRYATNAPEPVTDANFHDVAPLLREIRTLILDKDARGQGVLPRSGYAAEPE